MTDLADLFPNFTHHWLELTAGRFFARMGGQGPALLLLHGFPQSHVMWHKIAPELARHFTVVMMDLRGYGASCIPPSNGGDAYQKSHMANDAIELMQKLGFSHFHCAGHDRGGRVAYRLALDHADIITRCAVLDIIPTSEVWSGMNAARSLSMYHWMFLAQPSPMPETLIGADPIFYLEHTLASWTEARSLKAFDPTALAYYRASFHQPARVHAMCEDYRAGAHYDRLHDERDHNQTRKITIPLLALWGDAGLPAQGASPRDLWQQWADDVSAAAIHSGHFMAEENPRDTARALIDFFSASV